MSRRVDDLETLKLSVTRPIKRAVNTEALAATKVLQTDDVGVHWLDPDGAGRNVDLPAEADSAGLEFVVINTADAAENLTVRDDGGTTIGVVGQNEMGMFFCNGTSWRHFTGVA